MVSVLLSEVLVGVYLGLLAGIFPSFIAFSIGFGFKYFTTVTVPGLGVVVLGGALTAARRNPLPRRGLSLDGSVRILSVVLV